MILHDSRSARPVGRRHPHRYLVSVHQDERLSPRAESEIDDALAGGHPIHVPSISLVELVYLVDKGRIPKVVADRVDRVLRDPASGFRLAPLDMRVAEATRRIPRELVPDLPDRAIAATALALEFPLVTRDGKIRSANIQTIWSGARPSRPIHTVFR